MRERAFDTVDEDARRRFESAWASGQPEPIERYLPSADNSNYAATLLELEERPADSGKHALVAIATAGNDFAWSQLPEQLSAVREHGSLASGAAEPALYTLLAVAEHMRQRALALQP